MHPRKTDQARTALQQHRAPLDMRQRRLLILCDGRRGPGELSALLGQDAAPMVQQLVQAGYLSIGTEDPATLPAGPAPADAQQRRRSLAAARVYMLDILEMQRHPDAAALFGALQQARDTARVLDVLHSALERLPGLTSAGYRDRVRERLLEVLPKEHCLAFA